MIDSYPISFPELGLYMDFKNYFTVFGFPIYWYAVIICVGLVAAYIYADRRAPEFNVKRSDLLDGLLIGVPVAIVGARLFYVLFAPAGEIQSFADVLNIRNGGLLRELRIPVLVNSDAHRPELIDDGRHEAMAALREAGIREVIERVENRWVSVEIAL